MNKITNKIAYEDSTDRERYSIFHPKMDKQYWNSYFDEYYNVNFKLKFIIR